MATSEAQDASRGISPRGWRCSHLEKAGKYLFFADDMAWCWAWAICCDGGEDHGKVALIGGAPDHVVARSFSEFVEAYVGDPLSVS